MVFPKRVTRISQLVADTVIGAVYATAEAGNRLVLKGISGGGVLYGYTADPDETNPASLFMSLVGAYGAGGYTRLSLLLQGGRKTTEGAGEQVAIQMLSSGGTAARAASPQNISELILQAEKITLRSGTGANCLVDVNAQPTGLDVTPGAKISAYSSVHDTWLGWNTLNVDTTVGAVGMVDGDAICTIAPGYAPVRIMHGVLITTAGVATRVQLGTDRVLITRQAVAAGAILRGEIVWAG